MASLVHSTNRPTSSLAGCNGQHTHTCSYTRVHTHTHTLMYGDLSIRTRCTHPALLQPRSQTSEQTERSQGSHTGLIVSRENVLIGHFTHLPPPTPHHTTPHITIHHITSHPTPPHPTSHHITSRHTPPHPTSHHITPHTTPYHTTSINIYYLEVIIQVCYFCYHGDCLLDTSGCVAVV